MTNYPQLHNTHQNLSTVVQVTSQTINLFKSPTQSCKKPYFSINNGLLAINFHSDLSLQHFTAHFDKSSRAHLGVSKQFTNGGNLRQIEQIIQVPPALISNLTG